MKTYSAGPQATTDQSPQKQDPSPKTHLAFSDNRAEYAQLKQTQALMTASAQENSAAYNLLRHSPAQRFGPAAPDNTTGMPDNLKTNMESMSGISLADVKVHFNSSKPAQLQAHAYAQGADIHIAPGQEQHLPHEAWHVVQQKQGRVQATTQLKNDVQVNDDPALEAEADMMGMQANQYSQAAANPEEPSAALSTSSATQRKIDFYGVAPLPQDLGKVHLQAASLHTKVMDAIGQHEASLKQQLPHTYEEIKAELTRPLAFANNLWDLVNSPIDYGKINLNNPQHLIQFINDAGKFLNKNYKSQQEIDQKDHKIHTEKYKKPWQMEPGEFTAKKNAAPDPAKSYQVALLGTGASVANYLNVNGSSLQPANTIVIGKLQPWDPASPESRGINFVNHPMHMTSPSREQTQLPKDPSGSDETFEGNPAALSRDINDVLGRFGTPVNTTIKKVSRLDSKWYKIETDEGDFYALKVVSGLGIGPHKFEGMNKLARKITEPGDKETERQRVMDLDTFQRQLANPLSDVRRQQALKQQQGRILLVGVAGPNAGVDATCTATNLGMGVDWVVTGGPAIAEGMGNKISSKALVDLYFDYLNGWTISGDLVNMDISGKWRAGASGTPAEQRKQAGQTFLEKNPAWRVSEAVEKVVDYLVIAQGPDVEKMWGIFDKSATQDLTLTEDKSGRFGAHQDADFWQGSIHTSLRSSGYNIYWESIYNRVETLLPNTASQWQQIRDSLAKSALGILKENAFNEIRLPGNIAIGLGTKDDSLEIIGGSAIRVLNYLDGLKTAKDKKQLEYDKLPSEALQKELEDLAEKIPKALMTGDTEKRMKQVTETLSSPTILNNDQLTPIRSQIEAMGDYMPAYLGTEESNFVTDDQTMIAAQIASYYGNIPPELANWITQKIIEDRRKNGVMPGTDKGGRAFVEKWNTRLEQLHRLFSKEAILGMVK
jgi:hypothetical protein